MNTYRILYHHRIRADDGQAVHVREMIHALRGLGHEVLECALVPKAGPPAGKDGVEKSNGSSLWQKLSLPRVLTECTEILYSTKGRSMIQSAAKDFRPDFIYERHALHCSAGLHASRKLDLPLLLEVNSPMCDEMARLSLLKFGKRARRTEREVLGGADRVLAVSDVLAEMLIERGAPRDRTLVIRNGAEPARFDATAVAAGRELRERLGLAAGQLLLGFIGYMRDWHRLELVIEAMQRMGGEDLHFLTIGEGPALPDLMARAAAAGLGDRVHSLGAVPGSAIPGLCSAFDVALVPAINAYASPLKMFDTLAAGVATLAIDQPNIRELVDDGRTGVLFVPGDVDSLASQLRALVEDPQKTRAIGAAGREALIANDWTWTGNARRVANAYEGVR